MNVYLLDRLVETTAVVKTPSGYLVKTRQGMLTVEAEPTIRRTEPAPPGQYVNRRIGQSWHRFPLTHWAHQRGVLSHRDLMPPEPLSAGLVLNAADLITDSNGRFWSLETGWTDTLPPELQEMAV